jgi:hypothetical protein
MKLLSIHHAEPPKKYVATFETDSGRKKTIRFGAAGIDDYTLTHDKAQRERYRTRHRKDLTTASAQSGASAGALSWYILWGDSTSIQENIRHYKTHFGL